MPGDFGDATWLKGIFSALGPVLIALSIRYIFIYLYLHRDPYI